jgi:signal transduction histidine kinase/ActR/RegA family two-component response regulator
MTRGDEVVPQVPIGVDPARRVLMLLPTVRDAQITSSLLGGAGLEWFVCTSILELVNQITLGAGAILITDEALSRKGISAVLGVLDQQPAWSDVPVILMMKGGAESATTAKMLQSLRNVTLLERPAPTRSVVSAVQAAVRARVRQYEIRDKIQAVEKAEANLEIALNAERAARAEAERAGRMKDEFLATLSHELRTPLNAILGWSQLLRTGVIDSEELNDGLETIERNARAQTQLIEDLLDMSRIISGKVRIQIRSVDPVKVIEAAIATFQPAAASKGVRLVSRLEGGSAPLWADPNRLQQIVWNLLSNAIKFTPAGGSVHVTLHRTEQNVLISVADTGRGIDMDFLPHVFERFRQADSRTTREKGGLGLGLAIVKSLVELHGGTIRADSAGRGQGATFNVRLPLAMSQIAEVPKVVPTSKQVTLGSATYAGTDLSGTKVLVVDDEPDARDLACRILLQCSADVVTAGSAAEALALLESEHPDVLVSDIGMPVIDGYELLMRIRGLSNKRHNTIPAIALTAFARAEDQTRALQAGYSVHMTKPVEAAELVAAVFGLSEGGSA